MTMIVIMARCDIGDTQYMLDLDLALVSARRFIVLSIIFIIYILANANAYK